MRQTQKRCQEQSSCNICNGLSQKAAREMVWSHIMASSKVPLLLYRIWRWCLHLFSPMSHYGKWHKTLAFVFFILKEYTLEKDVNMVLTVELNVNTEKAVCRNTDWTVCRHVLADILKWRFDRLWISSSQAKTN